MTVSFTEVIIYRLPQETTAQSNMMIISTVVVSASLRLSLPHLTSKVKVHHLSGTVNSNLTVVLLARCPSHPLPPLISAEED